MAKIEIICPEPSGKRIKRGSRFGNLTVAGFAGTFRNVGDKPVKKWLCLCDCGNVSIQPQAVLLKTAKSCGCNGVKTISKWRERHGLSKHPLHKRWSSMRYRCHRKSNPGYSEYGGRGIKVCARWLHSFEAFFKDMGPTFKPGLSLDRIDNDGNYEPSNCRWATQHEQNLNRRITKFVWFRGKKTTAVQLGRKYNVPVARIKQRLDHGWPIEDAVLHPVVKPNQRHLSPAKKGNAR